MSVKAEALFKRHWKEFCGASEYFDNEKNRIRATIYSACIIAESIRNEMDEVPERIEPK